ncbi:FAD-binding and (Fe-S)-binding domain-containing protein [Sulfurimonas sp.]|uniref:FAD-binding and (Fe-S)-binding domain-containing protein n=1 Tax=Sulfurimonas sp. TaxID=2022749 RepID=UPI0025DE55A4|nr:FAD-binding and (Fe-S)-binding domain-containing protein [Sulfurimonas sp.]
MLEEKYIVFHESIKNIISKENLFTDKLHRLTYGTDASFYRLIPKIVIKADNPQEVQAIIKLAYELEIALTFRAAGTSLSGQAISDSVLVITSRKFTNFKVADDKSYISLEPALTGEQVNNILAPFERKIGPDPASINAAMIGGIAANNASGMCCGVAQNSYKTLKSIKLIMADGTRLDTADEESKKAFTAKHEDFLHKLEELAKRTKADKELEKLIHKKFKIKNTCGYSINSLVDYSDVFDILSHLIIGSEGTLAFIEEVTYYTVEDYPNKASSLMFFRDIKDACDAVTKIKVAQDAGKISVAAAELMDNRALKTVQDNDGMPEYLKEFDNEVTALLVETRAVDKESLKTQIAQVQKLLTDFDPARPIEFTDVEKEYTLYWKIRKGLFPAVGAVRKIGTTVIIEDVAYPIEHLADGTPELQSFFKKHNYDEALIFGHALEGNFHFVFTQDFSDEKEIQRYNDFMNDITHSVAVKYQGSLKAEHGTGRNMAAFIELEWGKTAHGLMKEIKNIFDEKNILNPDVIINDDKEAHLKNLKPLPATNPIVDTCIECGFCEPVCPSNAITFTPRHRIVANREISRLEREGEFEEAKELKDAYVYDGLETCATCSLCSTVCPVGIDTGALTKHLRAEQITPLQEKVASAIANNFYKTLSGIKIGLGGANLTHSILGTSVMGSLTSGLRKISNNSIAKWSPTLPKANKINLHFENISSDKKVVYFPSCISRSMGQSKDNIENQTLFDTSIELLIKAGFEIIIPDTIDELCCGMPFSSKGFDTQAKQKSDELEAQLLKASNNGEYPVLCDTSPCTKKMIDSFEIDLDIYEPIEFALEFLTKYLTFEKTDEPIAIHSTCSSRKMGLHKRFIELANMCSSDVTSPSEVKCCGFAGDRGFSQPELNISALRNLKPALKKEIKMAFSTSKTCEIGLSENSGIDYNSIFYLINRCTIAK